MRISSNQPPIPPIGSVSDVSRLTPDEAKDLLNDMEIDVEKMQEGIAFSNPFLFEEGFKSFKEHLPKLESSEMPGPISQWAKEKLLKEMIKPAFDSFQSATDLNEKLNDLSTIDTAFRYILTAIGKDP